MSLRPRLIIFTLLLALVAAILVDAAATRIRAAERASALERVANAFASDVLREACENDPRWFLAGPRANRPSRDQRQMIDADVYLPRPSTDPLPFEFFAFDEQFVGSSTAAPRFPDDFKRALRQAATTTAISGPFDAPEGRGIQTARVTGWTPGPCAVLLFRLRAERVSTLYRGLLFAAAFVVSFAVGFGAIWPTIGRIRRLAASARASAATDYRERVAISGSDEIASLGAVFNDAGSDLRLKMVDAADREDALQRHVSYTLDDVAAPLAELRAALGQLDQEVSPPVRDALRDAVRQTHQLAMRLENLAAVAKLRTGVDRLPRERVDVTTLVSRVIEERRALAAASDVQVEAALPTTGVQFDADPTLLSRAIGNVIDNAILYNRRGGRVEVELKSYERDARFSLRIADTGPGVSDEEFAALTANKRFRGDEARSRRSGGRGLGLALAREIADRLGLILELRRPSTGGLEAEFTTRKP